MNYSTLLKEELIGGAPHTECCRNAYLRGVFFDAAETAKHAVVLRMSSALAKDEAVRLYRAQYRQEPLLDRNLILFSSPDLYRELASEPPRFVCRYCATHFLRGLLISCGSATDPGKAYRLEFHLSDPQNTAFLSEFFTDKGWTPKCRTHAGGVCLYFKNSTVIEEILTFVGAHNALFALMNEKIERDIRNEENRATNCVAQNIGKSVDASSRCLSAVAKIKSLSRYEALSPELRETALLREQNPEVSLAELAGLHNPPITKSGLYHRIRKILEFADTLPDGEKQN